MRFALTDDQAALAAAIHEVLSEQATGDRLRKAVDEPAERTGELWSRLADLGVLSLTVPESSGGLGLGGVEAVLVAEQLGRWAVPGPVAESALLVPYVLTREATSDDAAGWVRRLGQGDAVATVRIDPGSLAPDADLADLVLIADGETVRGATPDAVRLTAQPSVDPSRRLFTLTMEPSTLPVLGGPSSARALRDAGAVLTAAQLLGAGQAVLDQAVAYAGDRAQFGRLIGSYQALKHQLADVRIALDFARPLVLRAGYALDAAGATRSRDCAAAKAAAADAARRAARTALQVHGAIGYTQEHDLGRRLTRVRVSSLAWGTPADHRARVMAELAKEGAWN